MSEPRQPERTCVGCRRRAPQQELLRLVVSAGAVVPDPQRRLPGRGAYLHPSRACFEQAERKRALTRALRSTAPVDLAALAQQLQLG
ncbi:YlxR family protein [Granulicoccus phenolivorans]|uniref:YlxR family protein n=1 Tax=Granulicoccus phenolivorans TaxID=266854 RepID=UPI0003F6B9AD|nr:YlxR family protein [Granulicoccus phenolivorans]